MGTMLQSAGLKRGESPETLNITNKQLIIDIHRQYADAGCDIIKTNTFGANRVKLTGYPVKEIVAAAINNAREAAGNKLVALDVGPTGKLMEPYGELSFDEACEVFSEVMREGEKNGADIVLIETMSDTYELKAAVVAAKESTSLPVYATVTFDESGRLLTGADVPTVVTLLEGLGVDALGFNCGIGPKQMKKLLSECRKYTSLPVIINPNAGIPRVANNVACFDVGADEFAQDMRQLALSGASVLGGCCGTTPEHIARMIEETRDICPPETETVNKTLVSSYCGFVEIGRAPVIIGERINPTGKKLLKQALREGDLDYIASEGIKQAECGAHILDVNVGLPEINEQEMLATAVCELQRVTRLPLQIDSSNPGAIERALRLYNGKALVNSVNGKKESMEAIFPIVKKYGAVVVALTLDENGIPATPEGRLEIARKIIAGAEKYGIDKKNIIVDTLTMTVSSNNQEAEITLEALALIKKELGVKTVLGVSNVSFGLPSRDTITSAFFIMAMQKGLDAAIINPCSKSVMNAYYSFNALKGHDENCGKYISEMSEQAQDEITNGEETLGNIIIKGLKDKAYSAAKRQLESTKPLDVINNYLVPALDVVGSGFEKGTLFLPQLLMSARAAQVAFEAVGEHMRKNGIAMEKKEKIIIATVEGDIHDIGKNIVTVLLENYGYDVIDLGKDVKPGTIVAKVKENDVRLIALSALMTTTVASMEKTIRMLRDQTHRCRIMVGGAVLTEEYAKMIGADFYAKDATGAVAIAQRVFGSAKNNS